MEALLVTIPADLLGRVATLKVESASMSPAKFMGRARQFSPPTTFDNPLFLLANASCPCIYCGYIAFSGGGTLRFENNFYERFDAPVTKSPASL